MAPQVKSQLESQQKTLNAGRELAKLGPRVGPTWSHHSTTGMNIILKIILPILSHSLVDLDDVGANAGTKTAEANSKGQ